MTVVVPCASTREGQRDRFPYRSLHSHINSHNCGGTKLTADAQRGRSGHGIVDQTRAKRSPLPREGTKRLIAQSGLASRASRAGMFVANCWLVRWPAPSGARANFQPPLLSIGRAAYGGRKSITWGSKCCHRKTLYRTGRAHL